MTPKAILHDKPSTEALSASLEDVLTATVIGAISYRPPALVQERLRHRSSRLRPLHEVTDANDVITRHA